jgi:hypothetical protein
MILSNESNEWLSPRCGEALRCIQAFCLVPRYLDPAAHLRVDDAKRIELAVR